ncbi:MAG: four helix bundle protein [Candidatus Latescibacteria bacterium]|nr:four helix bundle protein [Candidatus Latescibacterota bacterium]MCK5526018.1 four helix bundle protein [Candidatus Latescibacterota bacterium]MCK5732968.1 four helix bundle protein [Candidatus Latescibacterota bacterium]
MKNYREGNTSYLYCVPHLIVWQKAMRLVTEIYRYTKAFPQDERYGLISQLRRSSVSLPSNRTEGYGRNSTQDYVRFLRVANGSLFELQTQLEIARNLGFLSEEDFSELFELSREIERMLSSLIRKITPK